MKIELHLTITPEEIKKSIMGEDLMVQVKKSIEQGEIKLHIEGYEEKAPLPVPLPGQIINDQDEKRWEKNEKAPEETPKEARTGAIPKDFRELRWLGHYLKESNCTTGEAAKLCGLSESTIIRASEGFYVRKESFTKIVNGLGLNEEQKKAFKKSLTKHQRWVY